MAFKTIIFIKSLLLLFIMLGHNASRKVVSEQTEDVFTLPHDTNVMTVNARAGTNFTIKIKGNPTTGYGWYLNPSNIDNSILEPLNLNEKNSTSDYVTDPHPEGFVGVGGHYYFRFNAKAPGNADLIFSLKRPWETTVERTVNVKVNIN